MTDTEILDWLQAEFEAHGHIDMRRYGPGSRGVQIFTVSSQHQRAIGIRGAVEAAAKAATESKISPEESMRAFLISMGLLP